MDHCSSNCKMKIHTGSCQGVSCRDICYDECCVKHSLASIGYKVCWCLGEEATPEKPSIMWLLDCHWRRNNFLRLAFCWGVSNCCYFVWLYYKMTNYHFAERKNFHLLAQLRAINSQSKLTIFSGFWKAKKFNLAATAIKNVTHLLVNGCWINLTQTDGKPVIVYYLWV